MEPFVYGAYLLLERLGSGGSGEAFLARAIDPARNIPVPIVLKRLHRQLVDSENFVRRFLHEAEIALNTDTPHVAQIYDVGAAEGTFYMAMEYVPGWTFTEVLGALVEMKRYPSIPLAARLVTQALLGLDVLHATKDDDGNPLEFVHRDIAPKNIMLGEDGVVRIIDLGLGKSRAQDWRTQHGALLGSAGYMSPEQMDGKPCDQRADLYAMGVVLYELITVTPWIKYGTVVEMVTEAMKKKFVPPSRKRSDVPAALDEVLARAMAIDPRDRFATARQFLEAVLRAIPTNTAYEEIRRFSVGLFGKQIQERRDELEKLLRHPVPKRMVVRSDTVVLRTRPGVDSSADTADLMEEPDTSPSQYGLTTEPDHYDPSEVPTLGVDEFDSDQSTHPGLDSIPPGDTEPSGILPALSANDQVQGLIRKAMGVRARLTTNDPRRRQINEILALLALAKAEEKTASRVARIKVLRDRLEELAEG